MYSTVKVWLLKDLSTLKDITTKYFTEHSTREYNKVSSDL